MLLKMLKSIGMYLPFRETQTFFKLKMMVYHRFVKNVMKLSYGKIVRKEIHGITYELDLSEAIEASLYYSDVYELETLECLQRCITKDMVVFEIGANIGSHSFEIAQLLQDGSGTLYCFEPTDYAFKKLIKNHSLNHFTNIIFEKLALSDREEIQNLTPASSLDTVAFSASWDIKDGSSKNTMQQEIIFKKLDTYIQENSITKVDLLKIDVDGYELKIIKGGRQTISTFKPIIIIELSECLLHYVGDTLEELLSLLHNLGYMFRPVYTQKNMDIPNLIQEVKARQSFDCLCLHMTQCSNVFH